MRQYILFSKEELEIMLAGGEIPFDCDGKPVTFRMSESLFEKVPVKQIEEEDRKKREDLIEHIAEEYHHCPIEWANAMYGDLHRRR